MLKNLNTKILLILFIFGLLLVGIYLWKLVERGNSTKIILKSDKNPMEVELPEPKRTNLSPQQISEDLKNNKLQPHYNLKIDDIE